MRHPHEPGEKSAVIVPNAGHNLQQKFDDGKVDPLRSVSRAVNGIAVFTRLQIAGKAMAQVEGTHIDTQTASCV